ncbi:Excitatory amino acid transporter 4,Excitatory amino acid transporter 3 [Mytilus coruscus]|uniref:Amino acid transporter n=1 Tax=Mytilus coruscus TaxID=42192 RepID=A0A6J8DGL9_MYTCO|nr:Excitatory amino acid transporter 4,Excitatory amino acid transporter 3 [Mytilus coruscus]
MEDNKIPQKVDTHIVLPMEKEEENESCREKCHKNMKENIILLLLLGSVVFGCGIGFIIRASTKMTKREIMYLQFPGEILMRMLKMLILPLVISSLIAGIAGLDAKACGKIGLRTMLYFGATTFMAVILGIIMAVSIQPGRGAKRTDLARYGSTKKLHAADTFLDLIRRYKRSKRSSEIEKLGIVCIIDSIRDELRRTRKAEQLKNSSKKKAKNRTNFIKNPYNYTKTLLGGERTGHLHCSKEKVEQNLHETHSDEEREIPLGYCPRVEEEEQPTIDFTTKGPTWKKVSEVVKKARTGSAPGYSGVPYKVYKKCSKILRKLWQLFRTLWKKEHSRKVTEGRRVLCTKGKSFKRHFTH